MKKHLETLGLWLILAFLCACSSGSKHEMEKSGDGDIASESASPTSQHESPAPITDIEQTVNNSEQISQELGNIDAQLAEEIKKKKLAYEVNLRFKVQNVQKTNQKIWKKALEHQGYLGSVNLRNETMRVSEHSYSVDSLTRTHYVVPRSSLTVNVPAEKMDSFLVEISQFYVVLDQQEVKLHDLTFNYIAESLKTKLHGRSGRRMEKAADEKGQKLDEIREVENYITNQKTEQINHLIDKLKMLDRSYYALIQMEFYQETILIEERVVQTNAHFPPSFWQKMRDSFFEAWQEFTHVFLIGLVRVWWVWVLPLAAFGIYRRYFKTKRSKTKTEE